MIIPKIDKERDGERERGRDKNREAYTLYHTDKDEERHKGRKTKKK